MNKRSYTNTKLQRVIFVVVVSVVGLLAITSLVYFFSGEEVSALFKAINSWDEKNEEYLADLQTQLQEVTSPPFKRQFLNELSRRVNGQRRLATKCKA
jgi:predicted PurR-regulated permease PerM